MRHFFSIFLLVAFLFPATESAYAQDFLTKRNRFGASFSFGQGFNSSKSDVFLIENKVSGVFDVDFRYEHQFTNLLALRSGFGLDFTQVSMRKNPDLGKEVYYYSIRPRSLDVATCDLDQIYEAIAMYSEDAPGFWRVETRQYRSCYFNVPLEAVFRSKTKNFNRYYAKAGVINRFAYYSKARETGYQVLDTAEYEDMSYEQRTIIRDINRLTVNGIFGLGFEHSYGGHSSIFVDLEFVLAVSNTFSQKKQNAALYLDDLLMEKPVSSTLTYDSFTNFSFRQNQIRLRLGILF